MKNLMLLTLFSGKYYLSLNLSFRVLGLECLELLRGPKSDV